MALRLVVSMVKDNARVDVRKDADTGEFVAMLYRDGCHVEAADYFDDDRDSTVQTARFMLQAV